jgi:hypothetical protein
MQKWDKLFKQYGALVDDANSLTSNIVADDFAIGHTFAGGDVEQVKSY